jgi:hypothetical protein
MVNNKIIEQVACCNLFGCEVTYNYDWGFDNKLHKFQCMCGTINRTLRRKTVTQKSISMTGVWTYPLEPCTWQNNS